MKHVRECVLLVLSAGLAHGQVLHPGEALGDVALAGAPRQLGTVHLDRGSGEPILFPTIQAAVDAAAGGDTVLLSDGVFTGPGNRGVVVEGKNITIRSRNGPRNCVIDCRGSQRGFLFRGPAVTRQTVLRGVTITRGNPPASDELGYGGAVLVQARAGPRIEGCLVKGNTATQGGGVSVEGIYPYQLLTTEIVDCVIVDNAATAGYGGGIVARNTTIDRCVVRHNQALSGGGGIGCATSVVSNTLVADNRVSDGFGGGIFVGYPDHGGRVESCTIVDNVAHTLYHGAGGGIHVQLNYATYANCILWGNRANGHGDQFFSDVFGGFCGRPTLSYCVVEQGAAGIAAASSPACVPNQIMLLDEDPLFVDTALGDYRISETSPCRDAGDPSFLPATNEGDIENQPRLNGPIDIGSDEVWPGLALSLPSPGRSGETNEIRASGATAGDLVGFFCGTLPGPLAFSFEPCPGLTLGIADAVFLSHQIADLGGGADLSAFLEPAPSGFELWLQAISFTPQQWAPCLVSNLVRFVYP